MSNLLILTESGPKIGLGHIIRCGSLYMEAKKHDCFPKVVISGETDAKIMKGVLYETADWGNTTWVDNNITGDAFVIVDSYIVNKEIYDYISLKCQKMLCIDDYNRIEYPENSIVLNPTIYPENIYPNNTIHYLIGPKYVLIREEFKNNIERTINPEVKNIMITQGGTDVLELTLPIIDVVRDKYKDVVINIVTTSLYSKLEEIMNKQDELTKVHTNITDKKMYELMLQSDLAITNGGQTLFELGVTKTPSIIFVAAENQRKNADHFENECGYIITNIDDFSNDLEKMQDFELRKHISISCGKTLDSLGAHRVIDELLFDYTIRRSTLEDIDKVYELSNRDYVRAVSVNKDKINYEDHVKWYENVLQSKNYMIYIIEKDEEFLGQVKFNINNTEATIGISLMPTIQGKNKSTRIIADAIRQFSTDFPQVDTIIAEIYDSNPASTKSFEKARFERLSEEKNLVRNQKKIR